MHVLVCNGYSLQDSYSTNNPGKLSSVIHSLLLCFYYYTVHIETSYNIGCKIQIAPPYIKYSMCNIVYITLMMHCSTIILCKHHYKSICDWKPTFLAHRLVWYNHPYLLGSDKRLWLWNFIARNYISQVIQMFKKLIWKILLFEFSQKICLCPKGRFSKIWSHILPYNSHKNITISPPPLCDEKLSIFTVSCKAVIRYIYTPPCCMGASLVKLLEELPLKYKVVV